MTRRWTLIIVVAASLMSHLKGLTAPPLDYHYHRQVNTAAIARNYSENGLRFLTPQINWEGPYRGRAATEFPLYMWLTGLLWPLFSLGDVWGRLLSTAFSAAAAVYLLLFLERRLSRTEALWSATLFSAIPLEIYFGRTIQPEALALAATLGALYHWDRFLDGGSWRQWTLATAGAFLAISHKLPYAYALLTLAALTASRRGIESLRRPSVLAAPVVCLAGVYAWYQYASAGAYVVPAHPWQFLAILDYGRLPFFVQFQFLSRLPELGATWPGMALAAVGARVLWRRGERFCFVWWVSVALSIVAGSGYTFFHEYTSLPFAPVMASLMGPGLVWAWDLAAAAAKPRLARAALAAVVLSLPVLAAFRIKHWYNQNFQFLATAGAAAQAVSSPDDLFVCNQRAPSVYLYYLRRHGWGWDFKNSDSTTFARVEELAAQGAKFLMTAAADLPGAQGAWLDARHARVYSDGVIDIYRLDGRR